MTELTSASIGWLLIAVSYMMLVRFMDNVLWLWFYTGHCVKEFDSTWNKRIDYVNKAANSFYLAVIFALAAALWFKQLT